MRIHNSVLRLTYEAELLSVPEQCWDACMLLETWVNGARVLRYGQSPITGDVLNARLPRLRLLRGIWLSTNRTQEDVDIGVLMQANEHLRVLLYSCIRDDDGSRQPQAVHTESSILYKLAIYPKLRLQHLSLAHMQCFHLGEKIFPFQASQKMPLVTLHLYSCIMTDEQFAWLLPSQSSTYVAISWF